MTDTDESKERSVPDFQLYRQDISGPENFSIHCEPLYLRSSRHRWEIGLHRHDAYFQLFIITHGAGDILLDDGFRRFEAPAALFVPAGAVHGFRFFAGSDGRVITALADHLNTAFGADSRLADFYAIAQVLPLAAVSATLDDIAMQFDRIATELSERRPGNMVSAAGMLSVVLVALARTQLPDTASDDYAPADRDTRRMQALEVMIARHFRGRHPVSFYADQFGLSAHHLNRITRAHAGCTVRELVARHVIAEAKRLLAVSPAPVREVAETLGFADHAYFSRFFARQVGMAPGRWQAMSGDGSVTRSS